MGTICLQESQQIGREYNLSYVYPADVARNADSVQRSYFVYYHILLTLSSDAISRLTQTVGNLDSLLRSNYHNTHQDLQSMSDLITTGGARNREYHTIIDSQLGSNQHNTHQDQQSINKRSSSQAGSS